MKKNLLLILALAIGQVVSAQSTIKLLDKDNNLAPDTIRVYGDAGVTLKADLKTVNLTKDTIYVIVRKNDIDVVNGATSTFCWNRCFSAPSVRKSDTVVIAGKDTAERFSADYKPESTIGKSTVMYYFYQVGKDYDKTKQDNEETLLDSVVVVFYSGSNAINPITAKNSTVSNPYPNPANSIAHFNYSLDRTVNEAKIEVSDLLGTKVSVVELNNLEGVADVNTSNLKSGFYFYSFVVDGNVLLTRKMIVRH